MIESIGGRKVAVCAITLLICVGVVIVKGDVPEGLATMLQFVVGTYIAGNVGADLVAARAASAAAPVAATNPLGAPEAAPATSAEVQAIQVQTDTIATAVYELTQATALNQQGIAAVLQIAQGRQPRPQG